MEEAKYIWMNGKLVPWKDAKIHILTHSLHYGSAVFEGIRFYKTEKGPAVFRLKEHIARLLKSAEAFDIKMKYSEEDIISETLNLIKENSLESGYIRPIIYAGYGKMGLPVRGTEINVSIAAWPWGSYLGEKPIKVKTSKYIRIHPKSTVSEAKITGHYSNSILASEEIHKLGFEEALLLDFEGNVAEGPGENLFIVKAGKLYTPELGKILAGITRDSIMKIARDLNIEVIESTLSLQEVYDADEAFFTGTAAEVTPIASLDNKPIGSNAPGPITAKLKTLYENITTGKEEKYSDWLSYAN